MWFYYGFSNPSIEWLFLLNDSQMSRTPYPGNRKMWSWCSEMAVEKRPWIITALQCFVRKDIKYRSWERTLNTVKQTGVCPRQTWPWPSILPLQGEKLQRFQIVVSQKQKFKDQIRHFPVSQNLLTTNGWLQDSTLYQYSGVWTIGWDTCLCSFLS